MAGSDQDKRPLLMVDVDGVISLFGFPWQDPPPGSFHAIDGMPHFISASAAGHLRALARRFELVWATGWEERANEYLPHLLELPGPLPFLSFERHTGPGTSMRAHWKLAAIEAYAEQRPLAWIDDAFNEACEQWAQSRPAPTLLVRTEPASGLVAAHTEELLGWAKSQAAPTAGLAS
ncbi:MAG TPA: HAD domain-containing protein [Solirubrobacteraceae bacterium]|jgi:hypothetical protein